MMAWKKQFTKVQSRLRVINPVVAFASTALLCGCITLSAPDKPIVIELNINIQQEVVYRLDGDAKNLIEENEDIFG